jgi:S-adenosyl methyltransferase
MTAFDTSRPNIARVYDYLLGGKDNFAADRELAEKMCELNPHIPAIVRDNREFVISAVASAARAGIAQFVDLGAGLPTWPSVDEAVRTVNPQARVAYIDNDPIAVTHADALLAKRPGVVAACADLTDPGSVFSHPAVRQTIDPAEPICVILACVLHFFDPLTARKIAGAYLDPALGGSWAAVSVATIVREELLAASASAYTAGSFNNHDEQDVAGWLTGWVLEPPGVSEARRWISGIGGTPANAESYVLCATASKPQSTA